jgi:RNA polymerase subunit RPABC4/transcription elongation factor Spt4
VIVRCTCPHGWASGHQRDPHCPVHHGQPVTTTVQQIVTITNPKASDGR